MRISTALRGAAVLTVGLLVTGCAVRVRPATVSYTPAHVEVVTPPRHIDVDVHVHRSTPIVVNRPITVEKKVVVKQQPVIVEKKTTVVVEKNKGNNGNHYGHDKDKFNKPADRRDHSKGSDKKDDKKVAKND